MEEEFLDLLRQHDAVRFGTFTLKSGRVSPYFFNLGVLDSGLTLAKLGRYYAHRIIESGVQFDVLLGLAYKGIPLATATAIALAENHSIDVPVVYNRKEAKDHGEAGTLVGNVDRLRRGCRVLVIDDVLTAGTAVSEAVTVLRPFSLAQVVALVVGLDREEKQDPADTLIASKKLEAQLGFPVLSVTSFRNIMSYIRKEAVERLCSASSNKELLEAMQRYSTAFGTASVSDN